MRQLVSRDPYTDVQRMVENMDRAFDYFWNVSNPATQTQGLSSIPIDIYEKDGSLFICGALPGVKPEDVNVNVDNGVLTIQGETRQDWDSGENTKVYRREHRYGRFTRSVRLPEELDLDNIDAEFNNGFLTVQIPKQTKPQPEARRIEVRSVSNSGPSLNQGGEMHLQNGQKEEPRK